MAECPTNHETDEVSQWMDNNEGEYNYWQSQLRRVFNADDLSRLLKYEYEAQMPELEGIWDVLLKAAFDEINWTVVAEGIMSDD